MSTSNMYSIDQNFDANDYDIMRFEICFSTMRDGKYGPNTFFQTAFISKKYWDHFSHLSWLRNNVQISLCRHRSH